MVVRTLWALVGAGGLLAQTPQHAAFGVPEVVAVVQDKEITEASGIVASRRYPGLYYIHNDSGDLPRVFLIDRAGRTRAEIRLKGAEAVDYEDIGLAPGEQRGTFDVCVADIGDNRAKRQSVVIYRFPEVELPEGDGAPIEVHPKAYRVRYADGPGDAEAFCVHPRTGDGYILTKRIDGRCHVYRMAAPWDDGRVTELQMILMLDLTDALLPLRIVTAADISPDGRRLALRCYSNGWEYRLPAGIADGDFARVFESAPMSLPLAVERQGEALCYSADGEALLTVSEGESPTLWEVRVAEPTSEAGTTY